MNFTVVIGLGSPINTSKWDHFSLIAWARLGQCSPVAEQASLTEVPYFPSSWGGDHRVHGCIHTLGKFGTQKAPPGYDRINL